MSASGGDDSRGALYVAAAAVEHRRAGRDARLRALSRAAYVRGRAAQRFDAWRGQAPPLSAMRPRRWRAAQATSCATRCPAGLTMVAHSAGRLREALRARRRGGRAAGVDASANGAGAAEAKPGDDFLSGTSGTVGGLDARLRGARDALTDARRARRAAQRAAPIASGAARAASPPRARAGHRAPCAPRAGGGMRRQSCAARATTWSCTSQRRARSASSRTSIDCWPSHPPQGHDWLLSSTTTSSCRAASSTASCSSASASRWRWRSRRTACARTRPGRRRDVAPAASCARRASSRSAR